MAKAGETAVLICADCGDDFEYVVRPQGKKPHRCAVCRPKHLAELIRRKSTGNRLPGERSVACADCGTVFTYSAHSGPQPKRCYGCQRRNNATRQKAWREANRERSREQWNKSNRKRLADPAFLKQKRDDFLLRAYGLTPAELDAMLEAQGHRCAVCGNSHVGPGTRLHVDHCHDSKRIRGLLCAKCNTLIGLANDDPARLEAAAAYLRKE